jgi:hypothetical protein
MDFDWDDGNRTKAQKHGLTIPEIEHAMRTAPPASPPIPSIRWPNNASSP